MGIIAPHLPPPVLAGPVFFFFLNRRLIRNRHNSLWRMLPLGIHHPRTPRHNRLSLQKHGGPIRFCLYLLGRILLNPIDEFLARSGEGDMFDSDIDSFLDEAVAYAFVDNHPDGGFGYVVDHSRFAVVDFHWHTLLHRSVCFDVYNVADSGCWGRGELVSFFFFLFFYFNSFI